MMAIAVAAMSFTACSNDLTEDVTPSQEFTVQINAVENLSRTHFGALNENKYPTLWDETDRIAASLANDNNRASDAATYISDDSKTASFKVELNTANATAPYVVYAVSPSSAVKSGVHVTNKYWNLEIPSSQTPTDTSCDPKAQIVVGQSESSGTLPSSVNIEFSHVTAYAKINFTNVVDLGTATVNSVTITADQNIAGRFYYYVAGANVGTTEANSPTKSITIDTSELTNKLTNVWVALAPTAVSELTFTINTDKGSITKEVTDLSMEFRSGVVATFNVDMDGIELAGPDEPEGETIEFVFADEGLSNDTSYTTFTKDGINVIFGAGTNTQNDPKYYTNGEAMRMYRQNTLTISGATITNISMTLSQDYDNLGLVEGQSGSLAYYSKVYTWSGNDTSIEFYNKSTTASNNQVRIQKIAITYTPADDSAPFIGLEKTSLDVDAAATSEELAVTLKNINESDVNITCDVDWVKATLANGVLTLNIEENTTTEVRNASITLSANGATATVTVEQKGKPVEAQLITVAEFFAMEESEEVEYILSGTITAVTNTTYGNFDLTDDTGTVLIYGLCSPEGAQKYWATSGAKIGDDIVVKTIRTSFNNTPQGKNAKFVELVSPGTRAFYTVDPMAVDFASAGGSRNVNVTTYNTNATVSATSDNDVFTVSVSGKVVTISAAANELEEEIEGVVTINVGNLAPTEVKVTLAAKPAAGTVEGGSDDFHTISATNTSYVSGKTTAGWAYTNCAIFKGGTSDSSPAFKMIGDASNRALCMNGKTTAVGTITSPTLTTGCGTLKFSYGLPFADTKIKFRVDIKQNGAVVKTFTIEKSSASKYTKYSHEEAVNVAGDFQIVFTNLSPSNSKSNKDRTAIWNVVWTGYKN